MECFYKVMIFLLSFATLSPAVLAETSKLWGTAGEAWSAQSRLPDFSFAGYRFGEAEIPKMEVKTNVRDFGARGDGVTDDTAAFKAAIEATNDGALFIPRGRYVLSDVLELRKSRFVIRGEDQVNTILFFTRPLKELRQPEKRFDGITTNWSWDGGLIWAMGPDSGKALAEVAAPAKRGDHLLRVASTQGIQPGQLVRLFLTESDGSLRSHLYGGGYSNKQLGKGMPDRVLVRFPARVKEVGDGTITLDRPLRTDVDLAWTPKIHSCDDVLEEVGIENLTVEMPKEQYVRHWQEVGFNAIAYGQVWNGWITNVTIRNADSGIFLEYSNFCTVSLVTIDAVPERRHFFRTQGVAADFAGHHGIQVRGGGDNVISEFYFRVPYVHDLTVEATCGNVFCDGTGVDLNFDHHTDRPYENLFTNIDAGRGSRLFSSSGSVGPASGVRSTFWNIKAIQPSRAPVFGGQPWAQINLIGVPLTGDASDSDSFIETFPPGTLKPENLHRAQLHKRLGKEQK